MRVFVAGATGVIGRPLVRRLVRGGHEVVGISMRLYESAERPSGPALARFLRE